MYLQTIKLKSNTSIFSYKYLMFKRFKHLLQKIIINLAFFLAYPAVTVFTELWCHFSNIYTFVTAHVYLQAKAGLMLNLICVAIVNLAINTWGYAYFRLNEFPDWANTTHAVSIQIDHCVNMTIN